MTTEIAIQEANYVDPRAGNDKFYRTFTVGSTCVTQYGRNGTIGTFTKFIEAASPEAAQKAANAKFAAKVKKGYSPVRSGTLTSTATITAENITLLDRLADTLPLGTTTAIVAAPINAVDLNAEPLDDLTADIARMLTGTLHMDRIAIPTDTHPTLGIRPMLASVQPEDIIQETMTDSAWFGQFKYDGDRVVIEISNNEIRVLNRQGEAKTRNVGATHLQPFTALQSGRWVFDGEVVGRTLVLFDFITATDGDTTWVSEDSIFMHRYAALTLVASALGIPFADQTTQNHPAVVLAPMALTNEEKVDYLLTAVSEQREGIILRNAHGLYESGRRSTTLIKHKLIKDADVIITSLHDTKDSATLSVHDADGKLVEVGAASTIGKGAVCVGDVWVVTFLYVTDPLHPRLFQPRLVKQRSDKAAAECLISQFADAGTNKVV